jgi:alanine dehydrogenase
LYPKQKHVVVPRETKFGENRVGLTPVGLSELARRHPDYTFEIQEGAGELSKYADRDYLNAGRQGQVLVSNNLEVMIGKASHLIKFKEPTADEISLFKKNSKPIVFFGYGHFASSRALSLLALDTPGIFLTYETARENGRNILLEPMSEIAGQIAIDQAQDFFNVPHLSGKKVVVFGGLGVAGFAAAEKALKQNAAEVLIYELPQVIKAGMFSFRTANLYKDPRVHFYDSTNISFDVLKQAEVIVMAAYKPGQRPPLLLTEELSRMLEDLGHRIIVIDIAIDQGGSTYFTRMATQAQKHGQLPQPLRQNLFHAFIANMPSLAGQRASLAQEAVNLPYFSKLFELGKKFTQNEVLASALNFAGGYNVLKGLQEDLGIPYTPLNKLKFKN